MKKGKRKQILRKSIIFSILLLGVIIESIFGKRNVKEAELELAQIDFRGKEPEELTWEEYVELSEEEKTILPDFFESMDAYDEWYESVEPEIEVIEGVMTIDLQGKSPEEVTWEEYMAWTEEGRAEFPDYFKSYDDFKLWLAENEQ